MIGCGGHAKVVVDSIVRQGGIVDWIVDENPQARSLLGIPILNPEDLEAKSLGLMFFIVAIGDNSTRRMKYLSFVAAGHEPFTVIHPGSIVSERADIGSGSLVGAGAVVNPAVEIGVNCIVNTSASIDHDCQIGDHCHIGPGARLPASVVVEDGVFIGAGATVLPGIEIGSNATIGAGSVVTRNVANNSTVFGNPARVRTSTRPD